MKKYKYLFLIPVLCVLGSCKGTSEEELMGDWERRAVLPESQRAHAAYFVINNLGYVVGGTNGFKAPLDDVFEFNPDPVGGAKDRKDRSMGAWTQLKDFTGPARQQAVGFSLKVGEKWYGYIGTGYGFDEEQDPKKQELFARKDFWRFDPEDESWVEVAPLPAKARYGAVAFSLQTGSKWYVYVGCGYNDDPLLSNYLSDFWRYDPELDIWEQVSGYGGGKRAHATVFVLDNKAYISTGGNPGNITDFYVFDPNNPNAVWKRLRQMSNANPDEDYDDDYGKLQRSRGVGYVVMGSELRGYIVGGTTNGIYNWEYNHALQENGGDLWEQRTNFYNNASGQSREGMIAFSFPSLGRAYVGMGKTGTQYFDDLWEFFPLEEDYIYNDFQ